MYEYYCMRIRMRLCVYNTGSRLPSLRLCRCPALLFSMQSCGSVATSASSPESRRTRTYNTAQQDAEKRKEHADKGLDRRFGEETMKKQNQSPVIL